MNFQFIGCKKFREFRVIQSNLEKILSFFRIILNSFGFFFGVSLNYSNHVSKNAAEMRTNSDKMWEKIQRHFFPPGTDIDRYWTLLALILLTYTCQIWTTNSRLIVVSEKWSINGHREEVGPLISFTRSKTPTSQKRQRRREREGKRKKMVRTPRASVVWCAIYARS